jgi:hypothetical protein
MNYIKKKKIIERMAEVQESLDVLKQARIDALAKGYASATISSGGGSKSYTRYSPDQFTQVINELLKELSQLRNLLVTGVSSPIKTIVTVYV